MSAPVLAPLPENLDLEANYTLRVVAVDPTTGATVPGVNIGATVITATPVAAGGITDGGPPGELAGGDWFLVPGPGA